MEWQFFLRRKESDASYTVSRTILPFFRDIQQTGMFSTLFYAISLFDGPGEVWSVQKESFCKIFPISAKFYAEVYLKLRKRRYCKNTHQPVEYTWSEAHLEHIRTSAMEPFSKK